MIANASHGVVALPWNKMHDRFIEAARPGDMDDLAAGVRRGRRGDIARAISVMEDDPRRARALLKKIYPDTGLAALIGITGPAGAGKSSLIDRLSVAMREMGANPAVLAVDPSSHVTGGAVLGDRTRMSGSTDSGTYIRSIASRGGAGALARSVRNSARVLEYAGFDPVIIESVGAGQTEIGISKMADAVAVVFTPHTGDSIQALKAGLTEIGDVYVVNKSDLPGSSRLYDSVREYVGGKGGARVVRASAKRGTGVDELAAMLLDASSERGGRDPDRLVSEMRDIVLSGLSDRVDRMMASKECARHVDGVRSRRVDPATAAERVVRAALG